MSMIQSDLLLGQEGGAGYVVQRSLRFSSIDSAYLSRTPSSSGNRRTWTFATWIKGPFNATDFPRVLNVEGPSSGYRTTLRFTSGSLIEAYSYDGSNFQWQLTSSQVFRDPSAWFHLVLAVDTTQATSSNRVKLYINGAQVTAFSTANYPSLNFDTAVNHTSPHTIGGGQALSAYLADIHFIDGQALTPSSFTEVSATTGQLIPKAYTGSFGTNGFWLKFSDNSAATATTLGKDYSGNSNNWTPNNLSVTAGAGNDSLTDTPSSAGTDTGLGGQVTGNYCTWNPLDNNSQALANGNLDVTGSFDFGSVNGTIAVSSGKYYWEVTASASNGDMVGIWSTTSRATSYPGATADSYGYNQFNGQKYNNGSSSVYGATFSAGDVIGVALNMDAGTLVFYKNGASQGTAFSGLVGSFRPSVRAGYTGNPSTGTFANFGQRPFAYTAPSGFKALCDTNLPAPVVAKPSTVMDVKLYTGNGSTQTISGLGFSPDFVWIKQRNGTVGHLLYDQIRGGSMYLQSNTTGAEGNQGANKGLYAFTSDGFSVGDQTDGAYGVNGNNISQVAWAFDAGSNTVSNTAGSITSSCRTNQSSGFSIVTYNHGSGVGASTIGHGLNSAPHLILSKYRDGTTNWDVYVRALGPGGRLILNSTGAFTSETEPWNNTNPTSTVFSVGPSSWKGVGNHVAYCFSPVAGYSSFGSYTGNGSSDGPFVFTGMRPRWVMVKRTDSDVSGNASWWLYDTARSTYNIVSNVLGANLSSAETTPNVLDILSNGFKLRETGTTVNASGGTFIYAAFAESPFAYSRAR